MRLHELFNHILTTISGKYNPLDNVPYLSCILRRQVVLKRSSIEDRGEWFEKKCYFFPYCNRILLKYDTKHVIYLTLLEMVRVNKFKFYASNLHSLDTTLSPHW